MKSPAPAIGLSTLVFLVFLTLKLAQVGEVATWSWWWVTSPLWLPPVLTLVVVVCALSMGLALAGFIDWLTLEGPHR